EMFEYDALNRLVIQDYLGDWDEEDETSERWQALPRNAKGRAICAKTYAFDAMDNLERCLTRFADGSKDTAKFSYASDDSFQLTEVTHTLLEDYPATQAFTYDLRGNRLNDEQGRPLEYDLRGRLERVREKDGSERVHYLYDGHDQLLASVHGDGARKVQRRYQDHRLEATREGSLLTQYLLGDPHALAVQRSDAPTDPLLLLIDNAGSIVTEVDAEGSRHASYTAYGERQDDNGMHCLLAFNGELREEATGCYLLGSGYRAYTPEYGFNSLDSMPPEEVGINPYLYALGNPVRWGDPTGHKAQPLADDEPPEYQDPIETPEPNSIGKWLTLGFSVVGVLAALYFVPWTAPFAWKALGIAGAVSTTLGATLITVGAFTENQTMTNVGYGFAALGAVLSFGAAAGSRIFAAKATNDFSRRGSAATLNSTGRNSNGSHTAHNAENTAINTSTSNANNLNGSSSNAGNSTRSGLNPSPIRNSSAADNQLTNIADHNNTYQFLKDPHGLLKKIMPFRRVPVRRTPRP
ncbi:RHS repeat-associated core domain-containing protein, partial [Pseudomonas putida]|uniref:RHS repeat-associated core domain-containing protein n=1 Tax=Pseudomonas putida TaxID=303 RepID=UPI002AC402D6